MYYSFPEDGTVNTSPFLSVEPTAYFFPEGRTVSPILSLKIEQSTYTHPFPEGLTIRVFFPEGGTFSPILSLKMEPSTYTHPFSEGWIISVFLSWRRNHQFYPFLEDGTDTNIPYLECGKITLSRPHGGGGGELTLFLSWSRTVNTIPFLAVEPTFWCGQHLFQGPMEGGPWKSKLFWDLKWKHYPFPEYVNHRYFHFPEMRNIITSLDSPPPPPLEKETVYTLSGWGCFISSISLPLQGITSPFPALWGSLPPTFSVSVRDKFFPLSSL